MKRSFLLLGILVVTFGLAAPANALVPSAQLSSTKYSNCSKLTQRYPKGVASSATAAAKAVQDGWAVPKVNSGVYWANTRLDTNGNGVVCERKGPPPYIRTGLATVDLVYGEQARAGLLSATQVRFPSQWMNVLYADASICQRWSAVYERERIAYSGVFKLAIIGLPEAWAKDTAKVITQIYCENNGFHYSS